MSGVCIKCGDPAEGRYRPVLGRGRMERLCPACAGALSALVQAAGDSARLTLQDPRFAHWLETGRWTLRDGREIGPEALPNGWHQAGCPCCATFAEEEEP